MTRTSLLALFSALLLSACQSAPTPIASVNPQTRAKLYTPIEALVGRWSGTLPDGSACTTEFKRSAMGSVVVETMFPGEAHEMTNVYHLDGDSLLLTHYCGGGNQPRMRASSTDGQRFEFRFDSITDLRAAKPSYMGEMTLEIQDKDHMVQRWKSFPGQQLDHEMVFTYTRQR